MKAGQIPEVASETPSGITFLGLSHHVTSVPPAFLQLFIHSGCYQSFSRLRHTPPPSSHPQARMVTHSAGRPTSTLLSVLLFL